MDILCAITHLFDRQCRDPLIIVSTIVQPLVVVGYGPLYRISCHDEASWCRDNIAYFKIGKIVPVTPAEMSRYD